MTTEERNSKLYQRMFEEQELFRDWLLGQPPDVILGCAYEYVQRADILLALEYNDLTDAQCEALLKSPCPLADIYKDWEKTETSHMDDIWDTITARANHVLRECIRREREEAR